MSFMPTLLMASWRVSAEPCTSGMAAAEVARLLIIIPFLLLSNVGMTFKNKTSTQKII
jgi:hypothetical protein